MTLPHFNPSKRFLADTDLPCLFAAVKNSQLRGFAIKHIEEFKKDPKCKIYLRGADSKKITAWQQEMLRQLFENDGLAAAVAEGMKEFEARGVDECYSDYDEVERQLIKENTFLPYLTIDCVVIDDIGQKVLISANAVGSVLEEHGITIFLSEGRWRFEDADYLIRYRSEVTTELEAKKKAAFQQKWEQVLSPFPNDAQPTSDESVLYGVWRFDPLESEKLMKRYGTPQSEIEKTIVPSPLGISGKYFSSERFENLLDGYLDRNWDCDIEKIEHSGNWFTIRLLVYQGYGEPCKGTAEYWCDGKLLVSTLEDRAWGYTRVEDSYRKGDISPEQKQYEAEMDAWSARRKELMAEVDKKLKAAHEERVARERQSPGS
jgi:hypothetical protein